MMMRRRKRYRTLNQAAKAAALTQSHFVSWRDKPTDERSSLDGTSTKTNAGRAAVAQPFRDYDQRLFGGRHAFCPTLWKIAGAARPGAGPPVLSKPFITLP